MNAKAYVEECNARPKIICESAEFLMKFYPNADLDRFSISTADLLGYPRQRSACNDLCQVAYNIPPESCLFAEVEKIIEMLLHVTDTSFKIQINDIEVAQMTI